MSRRFRNSFLGVRSRRQMLVLRAPIEQAGLNRGPPLIGGDDLDDCGFACASCLDERSGECLGVTPLWIGEFLGLQPKVVSHLSDECTDP
jgi:hypothetical protein